MCESNDLLRKECMKNEQIEESDQSHNMSGNLRDSVYESKQHYREGASECSSERGEVCQ